MQAQNALFILLCSLVLPAHAAWVATTPQAEQAVKIPKIASALKATERFDQAILGKNVAVFESMFDDEAVVNNPYNKIARKRDAVANLKTGLIDYASLDRAVEYAARMGEHQVVLMGEESLKPQGHAKMAGKQLRRRTTEIWSDASGTWKLLLRQATIYLEE
ncbi:nuclear transport factor 2 family protein [Massilia sp. S19_KUP03_FR1]|uniref:nuclear transport factor 2 family protein n=1 Tax=Massilia sp. S19_KUP03_FR1 TaxID=3025503 RepID=UPI002FCD7A88